ncbi:MAG: hypothetical protein MJ072_01040, partial [Clostridia bacterium]|nr:hypothetical protein [Clostridia bacterium]
MNSSSTDITVKNGSIILGEHPVLELSSKRTENYNGREVKNFVFVFEGVDFIAEDNTELSEKLFVSSESVARADGTLIFSGCTFDLTNATDEVTIVSAGDNNDRIYVVVISTGGSLDENVSGNAKAYETNNIHSKVNTFEYGRFSGSSVYTDIKENDDGTFDLTYTAEKNVSFNENAVRFDLDLSSRFVGIDFTMTTDSENAWVEFGLFGSKTPAFAIKNGQIIAVDGNALNGYLAGSVIAEIVKGEVNVTIIADTYLGTLRIYADGDEVDYTKNMPVASKGISEFSVSLQAKINSTAKVTSLTAVDGDEAQTLVNGLSKVSVTVKAGYTYGVGDFSGEITVTGAGVEKTVAVEGGVLEIALKDGEYVFTANGYENSCNLIFKEGEVMGVAELFFYKKMVKAENERITATALANGSYDLYYNAETAGTLAENSLPLNASVTGDRLVFEFGFDAVGNNEVHFGFGTGFNFRIANGKIFAVGNSFENYTDSAVIAEIGSGLKRLQFVVDVVTGKTTVFVDGAEAVYTSGNPIVTENVASLTVALSASTGEHFTVRALSVYDGMAGDVRADELIGEEIFVGTGFKYSPNPYTGKVTVTGERGTRTVDVKNGKFKISLNDGVYNINIPSSDQTTVLTVANGKIQGKAEAVYTKDLLLAVANPNNTQVTLNDDGSYNFGYSLPKEVPFLDNIVEFNIDLGGKYLVVEFDTDVSKSTYGMFGFVPTATAGNMKLQSGKMLTNGDGFFENYPSSNVSMTGSFGTGVVHVTFVIEIATSTFHMFSNGVEVSYTNGVPTTSSRLKTFRISLKAAANVKFSYDNFMIKEGNSAQLLADELLGTRINVNAGYLYSEQAYSGEINIAGNGVSRTATVENGKLFVLLADGTYTFSIEGYAPVTAIVENGKINGSVDFIRYPLDEEVGRVVAN